jgi:hypothetical protein
MCHNPEINPNLPNLTNYQGVMEVASAGGAPLPALIRVSHIHLFGIAFILYFIGRIFILCDINVILKRITVAIPFLAMLLDVMSWYVTKYFPGFAYVVVSAGALMGASMGAQLLISLYQMWLHRVHPVNKAGTTAARLHNCEEILNDFGYILNEAENGWKVTGPGDKYRPLHSIRALEAFVREVELRHQQTD